MKKYTKALDYIFEHYDFDWEQGFVTDEVYEWLNTKEALVDRETDLRIEIERALEDYSIYEEEREEGYEVEWTLVGLTRFEISSFIQTLEFVLGELEADEEEED